GRRAGFRGPAPCGPAPRRAPRGAAAPGVCLSTEANPHRWSLDDSPPIPPFTRHTNRPEHHGRSRPMRRHLPLFLAAAALACERPPQPVMDLSAYRLVDLSHAYNEETLYWPTSPTAFELERLSFGMTPGGWFYAAN